MSNRLVAAAAAILCLIFYGCSSDTKLEQCPPVSILVDTASLPVLRTDKSTAPADVVYTAQIVRADRDCDIHKYDKKVDAGVTIGFRAARPRAGEVVSYKVPYFVAITSEGKVLAKREFWVEFSFAAGETIADFTDSVNSLSLTVGRDKRPADYGILVGFQLTKAQLEFNRKVGRYAP